MQLTINKENNNIYFKFKGELDDRSSHSIRKKMDNVIDREKFSAIVLDFKDMTFMDSTGIGVIIGRYKRLKQLNIPIYVMNPSKQVDKILYTCGLYQIIKKIS